VPTTVLWFRRDLRLADHPALCEAHQAAGGGRVLPLFVLDPALLGSAGSVRTACLSEAVQALSEATDGALVVRRGDPAQVVAEVAASVGAASVHISGETTPYGRRRDAAVRARLGAIPLVATGTPYAVGPGTLVTGAGTPYQVFTPFSRAWRDHGWPAPAPTPPTLRWLSDADGDPLPEPDHRAQAPRLPACSPQAAVQRWREFLEAGLTSYDADRDRPDLDGTSGLSMHLKYGTVHPRTLLADVARHVGQQDASGAGVRRFVTELCWREFYADVLWHRPDSAWADLRSGLADDGVRRPGGGRSRPGSAGRTGLPAGGRRACGNCWRRAGCTTGSAWSCASFLVKTPARVVAARRPALHCATCATLIFASNSHGWQWVAGTGDGRCAVLPGVQSGQRRGCKFDPHGDYVRRYRAGAGSLAGQASVHEPWKAATGYDARLPRAGPRSR
jgi:deoxyribodipyrimidine photo-lyase